jgi:hypothetical protein
VKHHRSQVQTCVTIGSFLLLMSLCDLVLGTPPRTSAELAFLGIASLLFAAGLAAVQRAWVSVGSWVRRRVFRRAAGAVWPPRLIP